MPTITISKNLIQREDLVAVPRKEYEALVAFRKKTEFTPTVAQRKSLARAERYFKHEIKEKDVMKRLREGMVEHRQRKTRILQSLKDLRHGN